MANAKPVQPAVKTGTDVQDLKGSDTAKVPTDNRVQVHQGNIPVLQIHFLSRIAESLERIAKAMEQDG